MARSPTIAAPGAELTEHELLARIFRTLGDARRLQMLELVLEHGELSQSELLELTGIPQSRASEHLRCLTWCGLLVSEWEGARRIYRVADRRAVLFIDMAREFLEDNAGGISTCRIIEPGSSASC
ncbi:ArsR/SmtB family transcription factor [Actinokineospora guangxiensis]|uniref:ArsR/SmtB family transcription factor n=1 Tax=Actinokineospora guangxiensis TaxID=1490288 RepID=A0ABW0EQ87_9PSEU